MTAALSEFRPPAGGWTTDDLDALPEDGIRRELIDGVIFVSPSPTVNHQIIAGRLMVALEETCPEKWVVTQGVEIRISRVRSLTPDVLVTTAAAARNSSKFRPREVVLAVEIVSPTSRAMDRVMKPALYAQAGVPFYWRVEIEDRIVVHTYRLDPAARSTRRPARTRRRSRPTSRGRSRSRSPGSPRGAFRLHNPRPQGTAVVSRAPRGRPR